jgi:hypothetical protein
VADDAATTKPAMVSPTSAACDVSSNRCVTITICWAAAAASCASLRLSCVAMPVAARAVLMSPTRVRTLATVCVTRSASRTAREASSDLLSATRSLRSATSRMTSEMLAQHFADDSGHHAGHRERWEGPRAKPSSRMFLGDHEWQRKHK